MNAVAHKKTYAHPTWLTTVTTRIVYKKGLKTLTTRIVYKIRGSSFLKKNLPCRVGNVFLVQRQNVKTKPHPKIPFHR